MGKKKRGAPTKICPKCNTVNHARRAKCLACEYDFLAKKTVGVKKRSTRKKKRAVVAKTGKKVVVKRKKKRGRPRAAAAAGGGGSFSLADIQAARKLVSQIGGSGKTKKLLDVLG